MEFVSTTVFSTNKGGFNITTIGRIKQRNNQMHFQIICKVETKKPPAKTPRML